MFNLNFNLYFLKDMPSKQINYLDAMIAMFDIVISKLDYFDYYTIHELRTKLNI